MKRKNCKSHRSVSLVGIALMAFLVSSCDENRPPVRPPVPEQRPDSHPIVPRNIPQPQGGKGQNINFTYFEFAFSPTAEALVGSSNTAASKKITAIGTNGNRTRIYFGTEDRREIGVFNVLNNLLVRPPLKPINSNHNVSGLADFVQGFGLHNTKITKIVAGPNETAFISVTGLVRPALGWGEALGGIARLNDSMVSGAWYSHKDYLNTGMTGYQEISSLTVLGQNAVIFVKDQNASGALINANTPIPVTGLVATVGPNTSFGDLGRVISAATSNGNELLMAVDGEGVYKFDVSSGWLMDFYSTQNKLLPVNHLRFDGKTDINDKIVALAYVGNDLLVGMKASGFNTGGIIIRKNSGEIVQPGTALDRWSVRDIAVSSDNKTALIATDKGLLFYYDNTLTQIENNNIPGAGNASQAYPIEFINEKPNEFSLSACVGAVHMGTPVGGSPINAWYVGTEAEGIFKLRMTEKTR